MNGFSGWLGSHDQLNDPTATLHRMACGPSRQEIHRPALAALNAGPEDFCHSDEQLVILVSGHPELRTEPGRRIVAADLTRLYRDHGSSLLEQLRGTFALAILDEQQAYALFAVDPLGIEPLCLNPHAHGCAFASRADRLSHFPAAGRELDPQSLYHYLHFHCVPSPRSIFRNQFKLQPGQCAEFRNGRLDTRFYWQVQYDDSPKSFASLHDPFLEIQERVVCRYADGRDTGAFLSGGLDSSTVAGFLSKCRDDKPDTYSIGFSAEGYDEMEYARTAVRHFNTEPHEYYVTQDDVAKAIPLIAAAYDEPFGNASAIPAYYCARMAREAGTRVLLAGDGGDEIFGGNERYVRQQVLGLYQHVPAPLRKGLLEPLMLGSGLGSVPPFSKLKSYIDQALQPLPDRMEAYNLLHRFAPEQMFSDDFRSAIDTGLPVRDLRDAFSRAHTRNDLNRILHMEMKFVLADNDLRKVNRMCQLAGVEVRYPMLDLELVDFAATVPAELKIRRLKLRHFFKQSLAGFLPHEIIHKTKHGFGLPFGIWLEDYAPLQTLARQNLESLRERDFIKPEFIDLLERKHREEHAAYYGVLIWVLMMLEQWLQAQSL